MVLKPAEFLVETVEAGLGEVLVYVEDPEGHTEEVGTHTLTLELMLNLSRLNHASLCALCVSLRPE